LKLDCRIWAINEYERRVQIVNTRNRAYQHPLCMPDACFGRSDLRLTRYPDISPSGLELPVLDLHQIR
jgi:hypothetical protein